jgi:uncharacterized protein with HEPN domain
MTEERAPLALYHILDSIEDLADVVGDVTAVELAKDRGRRYAAERCVEIISEASRRIPNEWKSEHPSIPWQSIAGIGSVIRHNYEDVNPIVIVGLRGAPIESLKAAVVALLQNMTRKVSRSESASSSNRSGLRRLTGTHMSNRLLRSRTRSTFEARPLARTPQGDGDAEIAAHAG